MRLLLDSHVVLWWLAGDERLSESSRQAIEAADHVAVSVVSLWELGIKKALGKLSFPDDLPDQVVYSGFEWLPIAVEHARVAPSLPAHHGDPFDRMLIAQALAEQLTIVTADRHFTDYDVPLLRTA